MSRRAFTLIEVMIVIAILGIVTEGILPGVMQIQRLAFSQNQELQRQTITLEAFQAFKRAFDAAWRIDWVQDDLFLLRGTETMRVILTRKGGGVRFERAAGGVTLDFHDAIRLSGFRSIDAKTVQCSVEMSGAVFPMYWRCGQ
ncbi:MAG: type II secretion system protein [Candidatus Riflebacteria bacterium]|nr:type II secretion system protein [Candidatus Riflebacteria bacterium]